VDKDLSVRTVERMVKEWGKHRLRRTQSASPEISSSLSNVEEKLRQKLGTKVSLKMLHDGKGEIIVEYYSADDLDRLIDILMNAHT
jgi:ParB family chromosome partitioning protein